MGERHTLEVAYQVPKSQANATIGDDLINHLQDGEIDGEEVNLDIMQTNDFIDNEEEEEDSIEKEEDFMDRMRKTPLKRKRKVLLMMKKKHCMRLV